MWRLKQLIPKEQAGLEGKTLDVGSLRLQIRSTIAEGGFSCVYLARDAQSGKQFALKHIVCNDTESLDLVKKEVNALKALRGHPNIVSLQAQAMYDMGRTKECFIVTEYCEKMMVEVLDSRGAGYFEEKQLLLMFREICNAVYAMHCVSPPMAHRDLKAENLLLGSDGQWKLCDFGSISTNHKRFEKADEMGIEEDIIRKHTTPAYRAPEMWDLYRRELINEKVDIWALGCLLYRMAYLKSAFDGDSKLQILNGNYRIPDLPKYSANITGLIKDMLNATPEARPTAMQVWQRVNSCLPVDCQKVRPDRAPSTLVGQDNAVPARPVPSRAPPPPPPRHVEQGSPSPSKKESHAGPSSSSSREADQDHGKGGAVGSFWSTQYAQGAHYEDDKKSSPQNTSISTGSQHRSVSKSPLPETQGPSSLANELPRSVRSNYPKNRGVTHDHNRPGDTGSRVDKTNCEDGYARKKHDPATAKASQVSSATHSVKPTGDEAFNQFVADFEKASFFTAESNASGREDWQGELEKLRNELKQAETEKAEVAAKYDKLTAICRSQRLEIQELKAALAATSTQNASFQAKKPEPQAATIWDLQPSLSSPGNTFEGQQLGWRAFDDGPSNQVATDTNQGLSRATNSVFGSPSINTPSASEASKTGVWAEGHNSKPTTRLATGADAWGLQDSFASLGAGGFTAAGKAGGQASRSGGLMGSANAYNGSSTRESSRSTAHSQPIGWSNF